MVCIVGCGNSLPGTSSTPKNRIHGSNPGNVTTPNQISLSTVRWVRLASALPASSSAALADQTGSNGTTTSSINGAGSNNTARLNAKQPFREVAAERLFCYF
jgi:hypothetical protein